MGRVSKGKKFGALDKETFREHLKKFHSYANKKNINFTCTNYQEWARNHKATSLDTLRRCYGSWQEALAQIEVESVKSKPYSREELIQYFWELWEWESEGSFDWDLRPVLRHFEAQNQKTGKAIRPDTYRRKFHMTFTDFSTLMRRYQQGLITREDIINSAAPKAEKPVSGRIRQRVFHRDKHTCKCGRNPENTPGIIMEVHHKVPRSKGGSSTDLNNLITLCSQCNAELGDSEIDH